MKPSTPPNNVTDQSLGVEDIAVDHGDDARPISHRILDGKTGNEGSKVDAEMRNSFTEAKKELLSAARDTKNHKVAVNLLKSGLKKSRGKLPNNSEHWSAIEWATYAKNPEALWLLIASSPQSKETKNALGHAGRQADDFSKSSDDMAKQNHDNEELIRSILSNPPTGIICDVCKEYDLPEPGDGLPSLGDYKAAIIRFYEGKKQFYRIIKSQSIKETIYNQGPKKMMKDVEDATTNLAEQLNKRQIGQNIPDLKFEASSPTLTWVHLPATNMTWMDDLLQRIMKDEKKSGDEFNQAKSFFKDSWIEVPDKVSRSRIMRPRSAWSYTNGTRNEDSEKNESIQQESNEVQNNENQEKGRKNEGRKATPSVAATAIYMPYLSYSFQISDGYHYREVEEEKAETPSKPDDKPDARPTEAKEPKSKTPTIATQKAAQLDEGKKEIKYANELIKTRDQYHALCTAYKDKIVHGSSTLDESYYHFTDDKDAVKDKERRNESQVATKVWLKEQKLGSYWPLIRVNQLWIWTIDDKWLISASSHPIDDLENELLDGVLDLLEKQAEAGGSDLQPSSASEMSQFIIDYCVESYERKPRETDKDRPTSCKLENFLSIRQTFSESINSIARRETELFEKLQSFTERMRTVASLNEQSEDAQGCSLDEQLKVATIQAEKLSKTAKDILDELNMLEATAYYQQDVQKSIKAMKVMNRQGRQSTTKEMKKDKVPETDLTATYVINDIKRLNGAAKRVLDAVNTTLSLQQSEVANLQARLAMQQGRVLMVFTVVTIVFLPLSFLTSFFALDVSSFQPEAWAVGIIFSVSIAFSIPTVILAFTWKQSKNFMHKQLDGIVKKEPIGNGGPVPDLKGSVTSPPGASESRTPAHQIANQEQSTSNGTELDLEKGQEVNGGATQEQNESDPVNKQAV